MRDQFNSRELTLVDHAISVSEELVSDHYKISESQWLRNRFDIRTRAQHKGTFTTPSDDVFAEVIRLQGSLSPVGRAPQQYDLYLICLQDHAILREVEINQEVSLYPFLLYIVVHELVHIVRFGTFLQNFGLKKAHRSKEEALVHQHTRDILQPTQIHGIEKIISQRWAIRHIDE
ncbi:MAG: hypothetical protein MI742_10765 [Desulfobacterales bacterium]|nr:hypothetical protein [Desulfobacterales bacterium]